MVQLAQLAAAVRSYQAGDVEGVAHVQQLLLGAVAHQPADAQYCESLLACVVEAFAAAGDAGKELLEQVLLEVLPQLAPLAALSQGCCQSLSAFCGLAAAAASPRDSITAFLEAMDQLLTLHSLSAPVLQFLCGLMALLPQQLAKLVRRKAAFATECLVPVAALAKAHGEVLQGWAAAQLRLAASQSSSSTTAAAPCDSQDVFAGSADDTLRRLDTFLAANWQLYEEFVADMLHKVLPHESDAAAAASCKQAVGNLLLCLLLQLTASWPPPPLTDLAVEVLSASGASSLLPSPASVLAPVPLTFAGRQAAAAGGASAAAAAAPSSSTAGQPEPSSTSYSSSDTASDAAGVVCELLGLLHEAGLGSWQSLARKSGNEAGGAALAALYASCLDAARPAGRCSLAMPESPVETLQVACEWCAVLSAASDGRPLVILKVIALLQTAAAHAAALQAAAVADSPAPHTFTEADAAAAQQLLPHLEPCIGLLASTIASAAAAALRTQASLALQQLLRAPGRGVCFCCLQELLGGSSSSSSAGSRRIHPEVAALLMGEVRLQLACTTGPGPFSSTGSVQLVLPWLQQHSAVGWRDADQLSDNANAVCAALAVVRLALLKAQSAGSNAAAASNSTAAGDAAAAASPSAAAGCSIGQGAEMREVLQQPLQALSAAATDALRGLQLVNRVEQGNAASAAAATATAATAAGTAGQQQERVCIPGDAQGSGQAVDAWLAVARVQDVLDRVLELL
uniref:Uncharacterized protein n=1 Tax=Tetradesmus obliquus TaxID=3088 RepID=A0A383WF28_TETOB|eukprot:jgi/Sobl393_1/3434/SZX76208.1